MTPKAFMDLVRDVEAQKQAEDQARAVPASGTEYWMLLTGEQAHELSLGRVPEQVQRMAELITEPTEVKCLKNAKRAAGSRG